MRNDDLKGKYQRINKIPEEGYLETDAQELERKILKDTEIAAKDSLSMYANGSCAKPGTNPHDISLKANDLAQRISNPNAVDREMFKGSANREKDVISMISRLFEKDDHDDIEAGYILSGGTESLNQASYMLRNKFFMENLDVNVRNLGIGQALFEASKYRLDKGKGLLKPRIIIPPNYHFAGTKGTDLLGLGTNSLSHYYLDKNFDIDENSLREVIKEVYEEGNDIMYALAVAGDTMHGKVHDVRKLSDVLNEMSEKYDRKKVPIIVDAAGSFMFLGVMKGNPKYGIAVPEVSFKIPNVEAIVGDPHKQPLPYGCGLLMLKDMSLANYTDVRNITGTNYLDMDEHNKDTTAALATIPTSRSGSNAFAIWAYLVYQGMSGLRREKENIWSLVKDFREFVDKSKNYELVCEPQTQVVSFRYKGSGSDNVELYRRIKKSDKDFCYVSHDTGMLVRSKEEMARSEKAEELAGLFITVMEHSKPEHMDRLKERLEEEAYLMRNNR